MIDMRSIVFSTCALSIPRVDTNSCISIPRKRPLLHESVGMLEVQVGEAREGTLVVVPCRSTSREACHSSGYGKADASGAWH